MRFTTLLLSIACLPVVVNAAGKTSATKAKSREAISANQLVEFMIANGDDASEDIGHLKTSPYLGFPSGVESVPIKADSTDDNEIGPDRQSDCKIVVEKPESGTLKPVCMLINFEIRHRDTHRLEGYVFRFDTNGKLEHAVSIDGPLKDDGHAVEGAAAVTPLDLKDPSVAKRAHEQLNLWLKRTAKLIAKKKAEAKKAAKKS